MMKKIVTTFILLTLFIFACKTNPRGLKEKAIENFGTAEYYQNYQRNIDRLYHMLQGTFVCYTKIEGEDTQPITWTVNQDSIITYTVPIKEPAKDGYWLICYQFMSSLPDDPLYCAVQRITPIDRDTFLSEFFESPTKIKLSAMLKDLKKVGQSIDLTQLIPTDEVTTHYRKEITFFKGFSQLYKDQQHQDLVFRQDDYEIFPDKIQIKGKYFSDIDRKNRLEKVAGMLISFRTQKKITDMIDKSLLEN